MQTFSSQSKINPLPIPQKTTAFADPLTRPEIKAPIDRTEIRPERHNTSPQNKPAIRERRKLPDEIRKIFENTSKDFASYAQKESGMVLPEKPKPLEKNTMDEWDRALLLGEYPPAVTERPKPKRVSFTSVLSTTPEKSAAPKTGVIFPNRIVNETVVSLLHHPKPLAMPPKKTVLPTKKPNELRDVLRASATSRVMAPPISIIPKKPSALPMVPTKPRSISVPQKIKR